MKHAIYAIAILFAIYPALLLWALGDLPLIVTATATVLLARISPRHSHPILAFLAGASIATWITGHKPKTEPADGPQIPAN
jgi:hypothetical protein